MNKIFPPVQGKALIWNNLNEDGKPNENTIHQAHPVKKGSKTIITKWFRQASLSIETSQNLNKHIKTYTFTPDLDLAEKLALFALHIKMVPFALP